MLTEEEKRKLEQECRSEVGLLQFMTGGQFTCKPWVTVPEMACVYALEMSDDTVKIGVTKNLDKRKKAVSGAVYLDVLNTHHTEFAPLDFMRSVIESRCHKTFFDNQVRGEFFKITFADACAELDRYADEIAAVRKAAEEKYLEKVDYLENVIIPTLRKEGYRFAEDMPRNVVTVPTVTKNTDTVVNTVANVPAVDPEQKRLAAAYDYGVLLAKMIFAPNSPPTHEIAKIIVDKIFE